MPDGVSADGLHLLRLILDTPLMRELSVAEQRYHWLIGGSPAVRSSIRRLRIGTSRAGVGTLLERHVRPGNCVDRASVRDLLAHMDTAA